MPTFPAVPLKPTRRSGALARTFARTSARTAAPLIACLAVGGCVLDGASVRDAAKSAGFGPKEVTAPDFVAQSRRGGGDFLPVGVSAPPREIRAKSAAGVKALEAELDASRQRNEARGRDAAKVGGAVKPPAPPKVPPAE